MPILFHCDHCQGMLSIAKRKAYSIIDCPKCGCKQVVPSESKITEVASAAANELESKQNGNIAPYAVATKSSSITNQVNSKQSISVKEQPLFERADIENLLKPAAKKIDSSNYSISTTSETSSTSKAKTERSTADLAMGVELINDQNNIAISKKQLFNYLVIAVFGLLAMFAIGYAVGRYSHSS